MKEIKKITGWYTRNNTRGVYIPNPSVLLAKYSAWTPQQRSLPYTTTDGPEPDVVNIGFYTEKIFDPGFDHCYYYQCSVKPGWIIFGWAPDVEESLRNNGQNPWIQYWHNPRSRTPREYKPPTISNYFLASDLDPELRHSALNDFVPAESANKYEKIFN